MNARVWSWLLALAGVAAYANSLGGPFVFDDMDAIVQNPWIRGLWPPGDLLRSPAPRCTVEGRPVLTLSFALNYAAGGLDVRGYHLANLGIHLAAGLLLFALVRRLAGGPVGFWTALLWMLHPLQTASVTYVVQRAESLMGLCLLLTLYGLVRAAGSPLRRWELLCVGACAVGMATKEVMVTAPLLALLLDRTFLAGSFREAWRARRGLHLALASTWLILGACLCLGGELKDVGAQSGNITPAAYFRTQPAVILHYLKLMGWPSGLVLDYGWPLAWTWADVSLPGAAAVLGILAGTAWALCRAPALGFLGAWFLLILAPTSTFLPLADPAFEHRLYLPLAAAAVLAALGIRALGRTGVLLGIALALGLGILTVRRNADYRTAVAIWEDTVLKRPENYRAHDNLGVVLARVDPVRALREHREAIRLCPPCAPAHYNLGLALLQAGEPEEALAELGEAARLAPDSVPMRFNLGVALAKRGRYEEAVGEFSEAAKLQPEYFPAQYYLGLALAKGGHREEAMAALTRALALEPGNVLAQALLGKLRAERTP